jgi:GNAT superfamily N-acetyltransferase
MALPSDGAAIASVFRDGCGYYVGLAPDLFQMPKEDGLLEFVTPGPEDNSATSLYIVAEVNAQIVGHLYAELISPTDADRFQGNSDLSEVRLFIHGLSVQRDHWRQGVATALVEAAEAWGRERGAIVALCDTWPDSPVSLPFWEQKMNYRPRVVRLRKPLTE